jgi:hypothetical protein
MQDLLTILPMAFVMVAGPQIVTAAMLATGVRPRRDSAFFLMGAAAATTIGVTVAYRLTGLLKAGGSPWSADARLERAVDVAIVGVLLLLAWKVFRGRTRSEPPHWMAKLETATPLFALKMGVLLFLLLPGDLLSMATVGAYLAHHDADWWHCLYFVALTVFLAGIPLLLLLVLGRRAKELLPKTRGWMTANSWIVSEVVIVFFLLMTLKSLLGS